MAVRQALRAAAAEQMQALSTRFLDGAFAARHIAPLLGNGAGRDSATWSAEVVRAKDTGRLTIRYDLGDRLTLYAKLYGDRLGARSWAAHQHLWRHGFGPGASCRVPEPIGFLPDHRLLVMRAAHGTTLAERLASGSGEEVVESIRRAACWLARLHATRMSEAGTEPAVERVKVVKLGNILARASALRPERRDVLLDLLQRIRLLTPMPGARARLVPTQGQFTPRSIFLGPEAVTVIDIDRVCLSDPAKDLAMFMQRIRKMAHNQTGDLARGEALATAFLDEYRRTRHLPASLPYYAAFYAIKRLAEASKASGAEAAPLEAYYLAEFGRWEADGLRALDEAEHDPPVERRHVSPRASRQEPGPSTPDDLRYVLSTPPGEARCAGLVGGETTVVQDTGTGRVTLRYVSADQQVLFAKLYSDGLGEYSFRLQKALWHNGFGAGSRFQVPEPLAFFPQRNLMLMRGVAGTPLGARLNGHDSTACVEGTRQAARWLAALHQSSIRIGTPEPDWDSLKLFRICVRLLKAAAKQPGQLDFVLDLMDSLKRHLQQLPTTRPLVQTHGRFHQDHVFLHGESIAVIDLDRSRPADPAKDVAEFIRVLRWTIFKTGGDGDLAHAATQAFLAEYLGSVPAAAASVRYYWFAFLMLSVLGTAGKLPADHPRRQPSMDFFMRELKHVEELRL